MTSACPISKCLQTAAAASLSDDLGQTISINCCKTIEYQPFREREITAEKAKRCTVNGKNDVCV